MSDSQSEKETAEKVERIREFFRNLTPEQKAKAAEFTKNLAQATADSLNKLEK